VKRELLATVLAHGILSQLMLEKIFELIKLECLHDFLNTFWFKKTQDRFGLGLSLVQMNLTFNYLQAGKVCK
jgi:hypothetical protein